MELQTVPCPFNHLRGALSLKHKLLAVLLCIMLVLTFTLTEVQEAHAIIPVAVALIDLTATVLGSAGLTYLTNPAMQSAVNSFLYRYGPAAAELTQAAATIGVGQAYIITATVADALWDFTHNVMPNAIADPKESISYSKDGSINQNLSTPYYTPTAVSPSVITNMPSIHTIVNQRNSTRYGLIKILTQALDFPNAGSGWQDIKTVYITQYDNDSITIGNNIGEFNNWLLTNWNSLDFNVSSQHTSLVGTSSIYLKWSSGSIVTPEIPNGVAYRLQLSSVASEYLVSNTITSEGTVESVAILGEGNTIDYNIVNRALKDASVTVADSSTLIGEAAQEISVTLADQTTVISSIYSWLTNFSNTMDRTFNGDGTLSINWEPLKLSGDMFSDRFPFSIPWDIKRAIIGMGDGDAPAPVWSIHFPEPLNWTLTIDLAFFNGIAPAVRSLELVVFMLGLLMATRKVIGGDS